MISTYYIASNYDTRTRLRIYITDFDRIMSAIITNRVRAAVDSHSSIYLIFKKVKKGDKIGLTLWKRIRHGDETGNRSLATILIFRELLCNIIILQCFIVRND